MQLLSRLEKIPAVDHHAHNVRRESSALPFEAAFTEATDPRVWKRDTPHALFYRRSIKQLAAFFDCPPVAEEVVAARERLSLEELTARCIKASNLRALLLDDGLSPGEVMPWTWYRQFVTTRRIVRIEHLAEELLRECEGFDAFDSTFRQHLSDPGEEVVGLKSIAAYRGGLNVPFPRPEEARRDFPADRPARLAHSPFYSYIVHTALEIASSRGLPVQFHTGFGDPDLALERANPLLLREMIEKYECPFVLLHAGYPFVREAGFLASVYANAWVDFGLALPFLSVSGMRGCLRRLLELCPLNKILYSSDASLVPELYYLGAVNSRHLLCQTLEEAVRDGDLTWEEAGQAGEWILAENSLRLYSL